MRSGSSLPNADNQQLMAQAMQYVLPHLSEQEQLNWRSTCRVVRDALQERQSAPYQTKAQFAMAITGNFTVDKNFSKLLSAAWKCYTNILANDDLQPAILHKLRDGDICNLYKMDTQLMLRDSGRIYDFALVHCWAFNAVWMLANIHKGRAFTVISAVNESNMTRESRKDASAFAKEIAAVVQANYTPEYSHNSLMLTPYGTAAKSQVKLNHMKLSDAKVFTLYKKVKTFHECCQVQKCCQVQPAKVKFA